MDSFETEEEARAYGNVHCDMIALDESKRDYEVYRLD